MTNTDDLISSQEAAAILGCNTQYVSRLAREGKIECAVFAMSNRRLFIRKTVEHYADNRPRRGPKKRPNRDGA